MTATLEHLRSVESLIGSLPAAERLKLLDNPLVKAELAKKWRPNPGPQTLALLSEADETLYGGQGGGGKTDLLLGSALTTHSRSLIMRRQYTELSAITDRAIKIHGSRKGYNGSIPPSLKTDDGRLIEFGAAARIGDEQSWQGRPHDLLGIDEAAQFAEAQIRFLMGWVRTEEIGQRCRVILATNPPLSDEGQYLVVMFAPWLDETFPDPAKPGELRWYIYDPKAQKDRWVDGPGEHLNDAGEMVRSKSRTFIPASVRDNPHLVDTDYQRTLDQLPEPLRSAVRDGNFMAVRQDHEWQVIPTAWIREAQARWKPDGWQGLRMTAIGVDVAQGGTDKTILAPRYGTWFAPLQEKAGAETPDTPSVVGFIVAHQRDGAGLVIDIGGGYGVGPANFMRENGASVAAFDGSKPSMAKTAGGGLGFFNKRAEAWWRLREALDPGQEGGSPIALPPDQGLVADLTAPHYETTTRGIKVEPKEDIKKRLGRSPDRGDAAVMAWSEGQALAVRALNKQGGARGGLKVNLGHARTKARRR